MDKKSLKDVLAGLTVGQELEVNFRGEKTALNGRYRVKESKVDRGKMGSRKAVLESMVDGMEQVLHTKSNDEVLNLVVDGVTHGSVNESDEPRTFAKDVVRGKEFTALFKTLTEGQKVSLASDLEPSFNGTFTVVSSRPVRGKYGQQALVLLADDGSTVELWSYRHSTALKSVELV